MKVTNLIFITLVLSSCGFDKVQKEAKVTFADQHFKTAIANIELYKIRHGNYPEHLKDLEFLGGFDQMIFQSVSYEKLDSGYRLDAVDVDLSTQPTGKYPAEFWQGLGIRKSNLLH